MEGKRVDTVGDLTVLDVRAKNSSQHTLAFANTNNRRITLDSRQDVACLIFVLLRWYFTTED